MSLLYSAGILSNHSPFSISTRNSIYSQKAEFIKNIEKMSFWVGDHQKLHYAKQELLSQINNLDLSISGNGLFTVDRRFMATVRSEC